jgi:hypothetical protein
MNVKKLWAEKNHSSTVIKTIKLLWSSIGKILKDCYITIDILNIFTQICFQIYSDSDLVISNLNTS